MSDAIEKQLSQVIDRAISQGAEGCDVIYDTGSNFSLKALDGELEEYKVSSSSTVGIRVIKNQQVGTSFTQAFDEASLNNMLNSALDHARFAKESPYESIQVKHEKEQVAPSDKIYKEDHTDSKDKIKLALHLEKAMRDKSPLVKAAPYNNFSEGEGHRVLMNSQGSICRNKAKSFSCYTSALLEEGNNQSMHYHGSIGRQFADLNAEECIEESWLHAKALLDATPIKTGHYDIIFTTENLSEFIGVFSGIFSGKGAVNQLNPFKDKLETEVAVPDLTIIDDPHYEGGFNFSWFDGEGNLSQKNTLIDQGVLKTFYHNSATAAEMGVPNTFNATRSPRSTLGTGGHQMAIAAGKDKQCKDDLHFQVFKMQGLHSGADLFSGNFSFGASGYLMKGEEVIQAVKGVTINGNFYDCLKNIAMIGDTVEATSNRDFFAPTIRFAKMSIAGN